MKVYSSLENLIGNTPIVRLNKLEKELGLSAKLYAKLEMFNPAGSVKDRASLYMINDAEKKGVIKKGATIIEPTSGNTGIGIAFISAIRGYRAVFTMPNTMSEERIKILKAYGAEVVLTDGALGMQGAIDKAIEIHKKTPNSFIPSQFSNPANLDAHYVVTGKEIYEDLEGNIDFFVAGIGTGATVSGVGRYLKEKIDGVKIVGVEPLSSPLITKGFFSAHKIQGIGANFIPENFDKNAVDEVVAVSDEDAKDFTNKLAKVEGILAGISSGASLVAGVNIAKIKENQGRSVVVLFPDTGMRYLSTDLFGE